MQTACVVDVLEATRQAAGIIRLQKDVALSPARVGQGQRVILCAAAAVVVAGLQIADAHEEIEPFVKSLVMAESSEPIIDIGDKLEFNPDTLRAIMQHNDAMVRRYGEDPEQLAEEVADWLTGYGQ